MDGRDCWMDNVFIERLWRSLKHECIYLNAFETGSELRAGLSRRLSRVCRALGRRIPSHPAIPAFHARRASRTHPAASSLIPLRRRRRASALVLPDQRLRDRLDSRPLPNAGRFHRQPAFAPIPGFLGFHRDHGSALALGAAARRPPDAAAGSGQLDDAAGVFGRAVSRWGVLEPDRRADLLCVGAGHLCLRLLAPLASAGIRLGLHGACGGRSRAMGNARSLAGHAIAPAQMGALSGRRHDALPALAAAAAAHGLVGGNAGALRSGHRRRLPARSRSELLHRYGTDCLDDAGRIGVARGGAASMAGIDLVHAVSVA